MTKHTNHPLAEIFPPLSEDELGALADNIRASGLHQPITTYKGAVLDGRNRLKACQRAGVEPRFVEYEGDDPIAFVISTNMFRRHLTLEQRAFAAAKLATLKSADRRATKMHPQVQFLKSSSPSIGSFARQRAGRKCHPR